MKNKTLQEVTNVVGCFLEKKGPLMLTTLGIGSGVAALGLCIKATIKAVNQIEEEKCARIERDEPEEMTKKEVLKVVWKTYIPTVGAAIFSGTCIVASYSVRTKQSAAFAAAYKASETAYSALKDVTTEELGEKKTKELQKKASEKQMQSTPVKNSEVIMVNGKNVLCFDSLSGRYFRSDMETIKAARNDLNYQMINEMYVSVNDWYEKIGLSSNEDRRGWNINDGTLDILFDTKLSDNGEPCIVITYYSEPKSRYDVFGY